MTADRIFRQCVWPEFGATLSTVVCGLVVPKLDAVFEFTHGRYMNQENLAALANTYPVGMVFDVNFDQFSARLTTMPHSKMQFQIDTGVYAKTEVVKMAADCIRTGVFLVSWSEISGATVVHVEDFVENKIYSHATLSDGTFLRMQGAINIIEQGNK